MPRRSPRLASVLLSSFAPNCAVHACRRAVVRCSVLCCCCATCSLVTTTPAPAHLQHRHAPKIMTRRRKAVVDDPLLRLLLLHLYSGAVVSSASPAARPSTRNDADA